jgi:hypothetical protein
VINCLKTDKKRNKKKSKKGKKNQTIQFEIIKSRQSSNHTRFEDDDRVFIAKTVTASLQFFLMKEKQIN